MKLRACARCIAHCCWPDAKPDHYFTGTGWSCLEATALAMLCAFPWWQKRPREHRTWHNSTSHAQLIASGSTFAHPVSCSSSLQENANARNHSTIQHRTLQSYLTSSPFLTRSA
eukprot:5093103-Amphidinium_carterae.2